MKGIKKSRHSRRRLPPNRSHTAFALGARTGVRRDLDLQLSRALRWIDEEADLLAIVLRSQIELRFWADHVSTGAAEAGLFKRSNIDAKELNEKMAST